MPSKPTVVYIAGPYRAANAWQREKNIRAAEEVALKVAGLTTAIPLCPHTMFRFFDGTFPDQHWIEMTLGLLGVCEAMIVLDGWEDSEGTKEEVEFATENGIHICFGFSEFLDLFGTNPKAGEDD